MIIGDVGTGKTTLCRHLISKFAKDEKIESHLILDPHFSNPSEFLYAMAQMFGEHEPEGEISDWQFRESIKKYLLRRCVDEEKTVVLIIDEGQKIPGFCLEILREFLNYEANEYKLLQIIIFAQEEFEQTLKKYRNFTDRIELFHILSPLSFSETRSMIRFRLKSASEGRGASLFSFLALLSIYRASRGYPRTIINLCHGIILSLIIQNRSKAGWSTAESCAKRLFPEQSRQRTRLGVLTCLLLGVILFGLVTGSLTNMISREKEPPPPDIFTGEKKGMPPVIKNATTPTNA
ncbi:AAA family ATPase, partial [bacterium]|nr:AAA family ATPase [bacterium]